MQSGSCFSAHSHAAHCRLFSRLCPCTSEVSGFDVEKVNVLLKLKLICEVNHLWKTHIIFIILFKMPSAYAVDCLSLVLDIIPLLMRKRTSLFSCVDTVNTQHLKCSRRQMLDSVVYVSFQLVLIMSVSDVQKMHFCWRTFQTLEPTLFAEANVSAALQRRVWMLLHAFCLISGHW